MPGVIVALGTVFLLPSVAALLADGNGLRIEPGQYCGDLVLLKRSAGYYQWVELDLLLKKRNHGLAPLAPTKIRRQKPCVKCVAHQDGGSNHMNLVPFGGKGVKQKAPVESKEAKETDAENPDEVD